MEDAKAVGRPKQYHSEKSGSAGAPQLTVRLDPEIHHYITTRSEGTRSYLERVVKGDMLATEPWYFERFRLFDRIAQENIAKKASAEGVPQWAISAALIEPLKEPLNQNELAHLCRRSSINRTGWPMLYCDQGFHMRSWGVEEWIDHTFGTHPRLDSWNLDSRGAFHHVVTRGSKEDRTLSFEDLLQHPALALEAIHDLFSALAGPLADLFVRVVLRNAQGVSLRHDERPHQTAPLGEPQLVWDQYLSVKDLQNNTVDLATDIYERFRVCFGSSSSNRLQNKQNLTKLFSRSC